MADAADAPLLTLLDELKRRDYAFVTPTPATHRRVVARPGRREARTVADILGWSLPFRRDVIDPPLLALLERGGMLREAPDGLLKARIRVSSLGSDLYVHSAFPTDDEDAVFFGPDSYRFARLIASELRELPAAEAPSIVDIGTGAGVGAIVAAKLCPAAKVAGTDINADALRLARVNARAAGVKLDAVLTGALPGADPIDIVLANPPYIIDGKGRAYRDGGGMHGGEVALDMAAMALPRLASQGRLILYTGSAILRGEDPLRAALAELAGQSGCRMRYWEIDPDVFGEELDKPAYADVDRIAVVAAVLSREE